MPTINLDEARAARREANAEPITVRLEGRDFTLPAEMPFELIEKLGPLRDAEAAFDGKGDAVAAASALMDIFHVLLENQFDDFRRLSPSMADLEVLMTGVLGEYGVQLTTDKAAE